MKHPTPTVIALIVVNALFFVATHLLPGMRDGMLERFALHFPQSEHYRAYQFVSHIFMHGSFAHVLLNMFGLFMFGGPLERMWGARRFLVFYFLCGLGAGLIHTGINVYEFGNTYEELRSSGVSAQAIQQFLESERLLRMVGASLPDEAQRDFYYLFNGRMVGASGAIYGVLVAFAILFPNVKLLLLFFPVPVAAKYFVPVLLLVDLFSGVTGISLFGGGIAHFAHIGGALIGFLLMLYWRRTLSRGY